VPRVAHVEMRRQLVEATLSSYHLDPSPRATPLSYLTSPYYSFGKRALKPILSSSLTFNIALRVELELYRFLRSVWKDPRILQSLVILPRNSLLFPFFFFFFWFFFFPELGTEPRALRFLGKRSATELNPQPPFSLS